MDIEMIASSLWTYNKYNVSLMKNREMMEDLRAAWTGRTLGAP